MPTQSFSVDETTLTMTTVSDFPVSRERLWDAYADARQIEKFWGPPEWPATFTRHDFALGGRSEYHMTGPDGEISAGYWEVVAMDLGHSFEVVDGFREVGSGFSPDIEPMRVSYRFESVGSASRLTSVTYFPSAEVLAQMREMGMEEGTAMAMEQIEAVVSDHESFAANLPVQPQLIGDTRLRLTRVLTLPQERAWEAHFESSLLTRWLLGPDGWSMPVCEVAKELGEWFRYEWESNDGSGRFGFTGQLLEAARPYRLVTTESVIGMESSGTVNELTLTPVQRGTLITLVITYPSAEVRDYVLSTGMTDGMESSYARLERLF